MEPLLQERSRSPVLVARSVVRPESDTVPVRLLNLSAKPVTIYKGKKIAEMETIECQCRRDRVCCFLNGVY